MPVLLFAFITSLLTGVAFGIAPAWMAARADPIEALRGASRSTTRTGSLPRKTFVVLQVALSLILISASGLLTTTLRKLENQNFGFEQDRRIVASVNARLAGYREEQLSPLYQRIHDSLANIPGVSAVALCLYSPQNGNNWGDGIWVDGHPPPGPKDDNFSFMDRITAGYFDVIGTPIVKGRAVSEQDTATSRHVAVINQAFARKFFNNEDPIGKHFGRSKAEASRQYEIVGIVQDARYFNFSLYKPIRPLFFLPEMQHDLSPTAPFTEIDPGSHFLHDIVIVTRPGASLSFVQVRQAMASVDPNLPVVSIRTLGEQVAIQFTQQRLIARLTSFFGVLSLVLASIGLYGVIAYNAGLRVNEVGVRMALGANRVQVVWLILRGAFELILFGLLVGLPLAFAAGRVLGNQLYGMSPYNPVVTSIAVATLAFCALAASLVPAFRASLVSPLEALRAE
jgi:predicted permease